MKVEDYYPAGKRWWVRLHEKGGKRHEMPAHHKLEHFIDEYLAAAEMGRSGVDCRGGAIDAAGSKLVLRIGIATGLAVVGDLIGAGARRAGRKRHRRNPEPRRLAAKRSPNPARSL
jgi:hypothetical protein